MVSEYSIGNFGWLMQAAFFVLALGYIGIVCATASQIKTVGGKIGLVLLSLVSLGMVIAGMFTTDPITITQDQLTSHGNLHSLGFFLSVPLMPIATTLVARSLLRNKTWAAAKKLVIVASSLIWGSLALFIAVMAVTFKGAFAASVPIGWPNRLIVVAYAVWLIVIGLQALKVYREQK